MVVWYSCVTLLVCVCALLMMMPGNVAGYFMTGLSRGDGRSGRLVPGIASPSDRFF